MNNNKNDRIDKAFDKEWTQNYNEILNMFNKSHKNKFIRWLLKPNFLSIGTREYNVARSCARFFFGAGVLFEQEELIKKFKS